MERINGRFRDDLRTLGSVLLAIIAVLVIFVGSHTAADHIGGWLIGRG